MPIDFNLVRAERRKRTPLEVRSMITVRLPRELHSAFVRQAHAERITLNSLCIAALQEADPLPAPQVVSPS